MVSPKKIEKRRKFLTRCHSIITEPNKTKIYKKLIISKEQVYENKLNTLCQYISENNACYYLQKEVPKILVYKYLKNIKKDIVENMLNYINIPNRITRIINKYSRNHFISKLRRSKYSYSINTDA